MRLMPTQECDEMLKELKRPPCKQIKSINDFNARLQSLCDSLLRKGQHSSVRLMKSGTDFTKNLFLAPINLDGANGGIGRLGKRWMWYCGTMGQQTAIKLVIVSARHRFRKTTATQIWYRGTASSQHSSQATQWPIHAGPNHKPESHLVSLQLFGIGTLGIASATL